jgi:hypothetical protein
MILPSIDPDGHPVPILDGMVCAYCHHLITETCITWWGVRDKDLTLHPACAVDLCLRILRDVHEVECRQHLGVALTRAASR